MSSPDLISVDDIKAAQARIQGTVFKTDCIQFDDIFENLECKLFFKLENRQRCKVFKYRGALNKIRTIPPGKTVCMSSGGNYSQAVAYASTICGCQSVFYMPENATSKIASTEKYGGKVITCGTTLAEARDYIEKDSLNHPDWELLHPYSDPLFVAGHGTIGFEILDQIPDVDTVVIPIGGGALISGVALALKSVKPNLKVIGVNLASCNSAYRQFHKNEGKDIPDLTTSGIVPLAGCVEEKRVNDRMLQMINKYVDDIVCVTEDEVAQSVALLSERCKLISEGAGATSFAALYNKKFEYQKGETIVCLVSGGNILPAMLQRCIERNLFLQGTRIAFDVTLPYGTSFLAKLMHCLLDNNVHVIQCNPASHVDVVANKECYAIIGDIPSKDSLPTLKAAIEENGWGFTRFQNQLTQ